MAKYIEEGSDAHLMQPFSLQLWWCPLNMAELRGPELREDKRTSSFATPLLSDKDENHVFVP